MYTQGEHFGQVRIIDQGGEPWFVAKDVADILGYGDPSKMYARLDEDEKYRIASAELAGANQWPENLPSSTSLAYTMPSWEVRSPRPKDLSS